MSTLNCGSTLAPETYPHGNKKGYDKVCTYTYGVNSGRIVWEGPQGGLFLYNKNTTRQSVNEKHIKYFEK